MVTWRRLGSLAPPVALGAGGIALLVLAGLGGGGPAVAADASVSIPGFSFQPSTVQIEPGDRVTWTNDHNTSHRVVSDDPLFDSGPQNMAPGDTFFFTFNTGGSFGYHCGIHPSMQGTVNVGDPPTATNTPVTPATNTPLPTNTQPGGATATPTPTSTPTRTPTATPTNPSLDNRVIAPLASKD